MIPQYLFHFVSSVGQFVRQSVRINYHICLAKDVQRWIILMASTNSWGIYISFLGLFALSMMKIPF